MARRIVLAVLALVAVLLGVVAVPLGVITTSQDRRDFRDEATLSARTVANVAEERLDDSRNGPMLDRLVSELGHNQYRVTVYDSAGSRIAASAAAPPLPAARLQYARQIGRETVYEADDWFIVTVPVRHDTGPGSVGTVVLARPTSAVDREAGVLWAVIAIVAAAGLVAAAVIAFALARWLSRPLSQLETAAQALGDGELSARSPADRGPAEIRRLAANFNLMAARLEALVRGHQATMADVSHQLRTPLAALRLRLELLAEDSDEPAAAELAGAQEEIARLSRMVNGLLAIARAENIDTPQVDLPVDHVIRTRVAAWRPAADERVVTLDADLRPARARMGEGHLEQILDNLIANALDALPPGGAIQIRAEPAGTIVRIVVADDGPGMSRQQQQVAFRRFATSNGAGTGLGLAIVDRLTVASGGAASLSDTPGGGLTVTIELPRARTERPLRRAQPGSR
ncbi:MAG TPA: HAMP domain-containing sensor histidine kinase [Streptosporangiaceae bacterium]|nr:HAMP domain-containing sensor histidine kinase [Streptosporangiaceae bacterium]